MNRTMKSLLFLSLFITVFGYSQTEPQVIGIFAASDGLEIIPAEDAEDNLDDFVEYLCENFGITEQNTYVYKLSEPGAMRKYKNKMLDIVENSDSSTVIITALLGAWSKTGATDNTYILSAKDSVKIDVDWLLNTVRFAPASRFFLFTLSPQNFGLPLKYLAAQSDERFAPGKIILDIKGDPEDDFDDWVSDFSDVLDDMRDDIEEGDFNKDNKISATEWNDFLKARAKEEKFVINYFLIKESDDFVTLKIDREE